MPNDIYIGLSKFNQILLIPVYKDFSKVRSLY